MMAKPPAPPCRDDVVVESGGAAPKSCLPFVEMRTTTAADGLLPTGKTSSATPTFNMSPFRLCATEETNLREANCKNLREPLPAKGSSRQNQDKIGRSIQVVLKVVSEPVRFWDRGALLCGEIIRVGAAG